MNLFNRKSFRLPVTWLRFSSIVFLLLAGLFSGVSAQTFTSTPVTTAQVGTAYVYSAFATDPTNRPLTFTAPTLPSWLTFSANGQNTATAFGSSVTAGGIGGVAGDAAGNIYVASLSGGNITKITPDGTTSVFITKASSTGNTYGLVVVGNYLYIAYYTGGSNTICVTRVALDNPAAGQETVYQVASSASNGGVLSMVEHGGYLYCAVYLQAKIVRIRLSDFQVTDYITSGIPAYGPFGVGFSPAGDLYIATWQNSTILKWNGTALSTVLSLASSPISDIKFDNSGYVYVSLYGGGIRKYSSDFSSFVTVASGTSAWGMSLTPTGALVYGNGTQAYKIQTGAVLSGTPATADIGVHHVLLNTSNGTTSTNQAFDITVTGPPTLSNFPALNSNLGAAPFTLTDPTSNSAGAFTYTSGNTAVATISGNTVTIVGAGTAIITAVQAANGLYSSGTITATLTVANTVDPTIVFNNITKTYGDANFTLAPTSNSTGAITYTSDNAAVATINGNTVTIKGQGTATITASQAAATGYNAGTAQAVLTVGKQAIAIAAAAKSKIYGDADPALTYAITSGALASGDAFTGTLSRDAGENVATYNIKQGTLALSNNYTLTYTGAGLTIDTRAIAITAAAKSKTYGTADPALTYAITAGALVSGDAFTGSLSRDAGENVGTYNIKQGTLALSTNYALSYTGANLTIGTRAITIAADAKNKTYGTADPALTYAITTGALVTGDAFTGSLSRDAGENVGTYNIKQGTLALSTNYALSYTGANLTIGTRAITIAADAKNKTYGAADPALTYAITTGALVTGDVFTGSLSRDAGENVGTYNIKQGTLALSTNYALSYTGANLTIGTRAITIAADAKNKTYGTADPALTYAITTGALVTGDAFTGSLSRDAGENVGTYNIKQSTLALSTNYALTYTAGTLTIGARAITVAAAAKSKIYGATDPTLTYSVTTGALVTGDAFTGSLSRDAGENVGTYNIKQGTLALSNNYALTYTGAGLNITTRAITVTADVKSKTYGAADPALTYAITTGTLVGTDTFTGALTRDAGENVNTYAIKQGTLALNNNYLLTYVANTLAITKKVLTVTANNQSKIYGAANPALTFAYSGFSGAEGPASLTTQPTASTVAVTGSPVNIYPITIAGGVADNYSFNYISGTLTVTKAVLTITADNKSRNYGVANPPLTVAYSGFVNSDDITKLTTAATAVTTATTTTAPGSYTITANGAVADNYTFVYVPGTLTIVPLTNANLASLALSSGTLNPSFATSTFTYKTDVDNAVDNIRLTLNFDPTATAKINGTSTGNGSPSFGVPLNVGDNLITLVVTAQDGVTKNTYTITVYRGKPPLSITATNVLTPNGDGKNDFWKIQDIQLYPGNNVTVYDQAGRVVYSKHGYNNEWDGTLRGAPLTQGTYYYIVSLGADLPQFKGFISILRSK